ncbi:cellulose binding domain-containing protein, partial [Micromonospora endophytica]
PPPTTTPSPTTAPPTTTPPPAGGGCTATYAITGQWQGGFQGDVRVTAGSAAISGWTVRWTFANGQTVSQSWGTNLTSSGATVTARNVDYNGRLGAGASTSFGFIGSWTGTNPVPAVTCTAS